VKVNGNSEVTVDVASEIEEVKDREKCASCSRVGT
jgi:hypothetical protein